MRSLICAVLACLLTAGCNHSATSRAEVSPGRQILFTPNSATLAQQKMCDEQAGKRFKEYTDPKNRDFSSYTSHYDPTVNVCYVRVNQLFTSGDVPGNSVIITDAFEGRIYASYSWSNPEQKKFWEVSPSECNIDLPGKPLIKCASSDEFDQLTEKYFGTAK